MFYEYNKMHQELTELHDRQIGQETMQNWNVKIKHDSGTSLGLVTGYPKIFLWFSSVFPGKCWAKSTCQAMITSFQILSNSLLINYPTTDLHNLCNQNIIKQTKIN
jgi:hypothetical protein